jgi:hypothetical protein
MSQGYSVVLHLTPRPPLPGAPGAFRRGAGPGPGTARPPVSASPRYGRQPPPGRTFIVTVTQSGPAVSLSLSVRLGTVSSWGPGPIAGGPGPPARRPGGRAGNALHVLCQCACQRHEVLPVLGHLRNHWHGIPPRLRLRVPPARAGRALPVRDTGEDGMEGIPIFITRSLLLFFPNPELYRLS